jgi:hypothetical protein
MTRKPRRTSARPAVEQSHAGAAVHGARRRVDVNGEILDERGGIGGGGAGGAHGVEVRDETGPARFVVHVGGQHPHVDDEAADVYQPRHRGVLLEHPTAPSGRAKTPRLSVRLIGSALMTGRRLTTPSAAASSIALGDDDTVRGLAMELATLVTRPVLGITRDIWSCTLA